MPNHLHLCLTLVFIFLGSQPKTNAQETYPPEGFVYIHEVIPEVIYEVRYFGNHNFIGKPITGYEKPVSLLSQEAAQALKRAQERLKSQGYTLKIFDAYRPQRAVNHFMEWAKDVNDTTMKAEFYPEVDKKNLFKLGYIASKSGHSRGSTVDLTLVDLSTGEELDMGTRYDFFGEKSHHGAAGLTQQQERNRSLLRDAMEEAGFRAYQEEWWHYSLRNEPYPDTYFDFVVK